MKPPREQYAQLEAYVLMNTVDFGKKIGSIMNHFGVISSMEL
jgi:hypothetical protein